MGTQMTVLERRYRTIECPHGGHNALRNSIDARPEINGRQYRLCQAVTPQQSREVTLRQRDADLLELSMRLTECFDIDEL